LQAAADSLGTKINLTSAFSITKIYREARSELVCIFGKTLPKEKIFAQFNLA
jgi:hypothetical protein